MAAEGSASPLVLSAGEPAGIGPDLCVLLAHTPPPERTVIVADRGLLETRARLLGLPLDLPDYQPGTTDALSLLSLPLAAPCEPGRLDRANARYVLDVLRRAVRGCMDGEFLGLVTGPVHKGVINDAGMPFTGHTEFLAQLTATPAVVMMLAGAWASGRHLRVALATTHLPLKDVAAAITAERLTAILRLLDAALRRDFGCARPRILVAGLNPHAGEGGHLGDEEIRVIAPVLAALSAEGLDLAGPLPADTLFQPGYLENADAVLAMYHDQGLPVLKHACFGRAVNITLGLPFIRTSVDHGTALDRAGSGRVNDGSLREALAVAAAMARSRHGARL